MTSWVGVCQKRGPTSINVSVLSICLVPNWDSVNICWMNGLGPARPFLLDTQHESWPLPLDQADSDSELEILGVLSRSQNKLLITLCTHNKLLKAVWFLKYKSVGMRYFGSLTSNSDSVGESEFIWVSVQLQEWLIFVLNSHMIQKCVNDSAC